MDSVYSDDQKLTAHLMSPDFFEVRQFPEASFVSTQIVPGQQGTTHTIVGKLTLHGVTREVALNANIRWQQQGLSIAGQTVIKRSEFGMTYGQGQIHDEVPILFSLLAAPPAEPAIARQPGRVVR